MGNSMGEGILIYISRHDILILNETLAGYKLIYHRGAVKFIAKHEKAMQERIAQGLKGLLIIPPCGDIKPMKGYRGRSV